MHFSGMARPLHLRSSQYRTPHAQLCHSNAAKQGEVIMLISAPPMPTIGEIARRLGQPIHRIEYVIRTRHIRPCGWAGTARVFPEDAVQIITGELQRIATAKGRDQANGHDG
jgi:hypothetical protein